jgi:hypothetical protein
MLHLGNHGLELQSLEVQYDGWLLLETVMVQPVAEPKAVSVPPP